MVSVLFNQELNSYKIYNANPYFGGSCHSGEKFQRTNSQLDRSGCRNKGILIMFGGIQLSLEPIGFKRADFENNYISGF
jgi:hypothetical protein